MPSRSSRTTPSLVAEPGLPLKRTRRRTKETHSTTSLESPEDASVATSSLVSTIPVISNSSTSIKLLPYPLPPKLAGLTPSDLVLLHSKQRQIQASTLLSWFGNSNWAPAAQATLVFAQEEAGTAVCIAPSGLLLTCAHCVAERHEELDRTGTKWLLFASGQIVGAKCTAWDLRRDLALLQIIAAQPLPTSPDSVSPSSTSFPFISLSPIPPPPRSALLCIGHPGSEDLETAIPGVKTGYAVLHASNGIFRGYEPGQDVQDNSEIGALRHDCWTYWGHSGAPLFHRASGRLIGLHSSWDNTTGMRRGVGWEAVREFLLERGGGVV